jgi:hypothetical protein
MRAKTTCSSSRRPPCAHFAQSLVPALTDADPALEAVVTVASSCRRRATHSSAAELGSQSLSVEPTRNRAKNLPPVVFVTAPSQLLGT